MTSTPTEDERALDRPARRASVDAQASDVDAIARVARGDKAALGELYDRYAGLMMALGARIFGGHARDVEDTLHDLFVEIWKRAGDYDPRRGSVRTWILLRMRSRCLDRVRAPAWSRRHSMTDREEAMLARSAAISGRPGAHRGDETSADRRRVRAVVHALPDIQREVLELGYFGGLSMREIAAHLDIPIGTVKSRTRAALIAMRAAFEEGV